MATDVYARVVTIPLATTVQVNLLLPCTGGHSVELSVTEHALSKSWERVKLYWSRSPVVQGFDCNLSLSSLQILMNARLEQSAMTISFALTLMGVRDAFLN